MRGPAILVALSAVFISTVAFAATVTPERGEVLLNRGEGYRLVKEATEVVAGNQLIANPHGKGQVVFADGCVLKVEPGVVVTIPDQSPCTRQGQQVETGGSLKDDPIPEQRDDRRYLLKGLIIGGVVGGAILLFDKDKDNPSSP